jgi:hypothetical protein
VGGEHLCGLVRWRGMVSSFLRLLLLLLSGLQGCRYNMCLLLLPCVSTEYGVRSKLSTGRGCCRICMYHVYVGGRRTYLHTCTNTDTTCPLGHPSVRRFSFPAEAALSSFSLSPAAHRCLSPASDTYSPPGARTRPSQNSNFDFFFPPADIISRDCVGVREGGLALHGYGTHAYRHGAEAVPALSPARSTGTSTCYRRTGLRSPSGDRGPTVWPPFTRLSRDVDSSLAENTQLFRSFRPDPEKDSDAT